MSENEGVKGDLVVLPLAASFQRSDRDVPSLPTAVTRKSSQNYCLPVC